MSTLQGESARLLRGTHVHARGLQGVHVEAPAGARRRASLRCMQAEGCAACREALAPGLGANEGPG